METAAAGVPSLSDAASQVSGSAATTMTVPDAQARAAEGMSLEEALRLGEEARKKAAALELLVKNQRAWIQHATSRLSALETPVDPAASPARSRAPRSPAEPAASLPAGPVPASPAAQL
eukprot:8760789-Pyramimonas_sp.AAC.1